MSKVEAIQGNDRQHRALRNLSNGAVVGAAAGLGAKYIIPLTPEEKGSDEYVKIMDKIHKQKTEYSFRTEKYIESLKAKQSKSLAEDEFVRMFNGMKEGDHVKRSSIRNAIRKLEAMNPLEAAEFKNLCKESSKIAEKTAKQCIDAYNIATKRIRPTGFFVMAGAVVGAFVALINDVLKTEVKH